MDLLSIKYVSSGIAFLPNLVMLATALKLLGLEKSKLLIINSISSLTLLTFLGFVSTSFKLKFIKTTPKIIVTVMPNSKTVININLTVCSTFIFFTLYLYFTIFPNFYQITYLLK